jgi:hypothetical protein
MTLVDKLLILVMAAHVALTFYILVRMGLERVPRVLRGEIAMRDIAVDRDAYPLKARLLSNNFDNQFQLPVFFHLAALLSLWSGMTGWLEVLLGLGFVVLRFAHTLIHTGSNNVFRRFQVYSLGFGVLGLFWIIVVGKILLAPGVL